MIYFLQRSDALVKIGYTENYYVRVRGLRVKYGKLELLGWQDGGRNVEAELHGIFSSYRMDGEFFTLCDDLRTHIRLNAYREPPPRVKERRFAAMWDLIKSPEYQDRETVRIIERQRKEIEWLAQINKSLEAALSDEARVLELESERDARIRAEAERDLLRELLREQMGKG